MTRQRNSAKRRQDLRPKKWRNSWGLNFQPQIQTRWIHAPIDPVPTLGTTKPGDLKAAPAPQKKTLKHSVEKDAVSPATNKATCPRIAQTKFPQNKIKARLRHELPKPMRMTKPG